MGVQHRRKQWDALEDKVFDVVVIGGGINGVCIYHHLCRAGYSVLLVDKNDFAGGTSQSSAMMIWGGLLYLRQWDFATVKRLCTSRDRMLREMGDWVKPRRFRYIPVNGAHGGRAMVHAALQFYWALGGFRRLRPRWENSFSEGGFLARDCCQGSLVYEEASVEPSDARFVLHWLLQYQNGEQAAMNYCAVEDGAFDHSAREWRLGLRDALNSKTCRVRSRSVINAAGVWTDALNERFGVRTPYKHVLSKGVFLALPRDPRHQVPLIFGTRENGDGMSLIPWGPVSLWGPTATIVDKPEDGFEVQPQDVRELLDELNPHLAKPVSPSDVVSLRCGVRSLVVDRAFNGRCHTMELSRRHRIHVDDRRAWISVYGGKLTNCVPLAQEVVGRVASVCPPARRNGNGAGHRVPDAPVDFFPTLNQPIPDARWCASREMCCTLDDYLRRRTNVSQWVARGGLGKNDENVAHLTRLASVFCEGDGNAARLAVEVYRRNIIQRHDRVLCSASP